MNQTEIRNQVLLKLYEAFFLSYDWCSLRGLDELAGWDRTTFRNVLDRLQNEGLIRGRPGGFYILTGFGAIHAEETGIAPQDLRHINENARELILRTLAQVYEDKGHLYSASMADILEQSALKGTAIETQRLELIDYEVVLGSNRQVLLDINYIEAVGNAQFKITYRGLDAFKGRGQTAADAETEYPAKQTSDKPELSTRNQVFISYSRKDKKWLDRLQTHLKPFVRDKKISVWDDTKIKSGDDWREEIRKALESARVAVLLVTPDFIASDFIAEHELPPLLEAAQKEGLTILWIAVSHSSYAETEIGRYQAVNDPSRPLASLTSVNREKEFVRICREIKAAASLEGSQNEEKTKRPIEAAPEAHLPAEAQRPSAEQLVREGRLDELEERLKPRYLKPEQGAKLLELLRTPTKGPVVIWQPMGDAEAASFATEFIEVLKAAGWTIADVQSHTFHPPQPPGLRVLVSDPIPQRADALLVALRMAGLQATGHVAMAGPDEVILFVNTKP